MISSCYRAIGDRKLGKLLNIPEIFNLYVSYIESIDGITGLFNYIYKKQKEILNPKSEVAKICLRVGPNRISDVKLLLKTRLRNRVLKFITTIADNPEQYVSKAVDQGCSSKKRENEERESTLPLKKRRITMTSCENPSGNQSIEGQSTEMTSRENPFGSFTLYQLVGILRLAQQTTPSTTMSSAVPTSQQFGNFNLVQLRDILRSEQHTTPSTTMSSAAPAKQCHPSAQTLGWLCCIAKVKRTGSY